VKASRPREAKAIPRGRRSRIMVVFSERREGKPCNARILIATSLSGRPDPC